MSSNNNKRRKRKGRKKRKSQYRKEARIEENKERISLSKIIQQNTPKLEINPFSFNFLDPELRTSVLARKVDKNIQNSFKSLPLSSNTQKSLKEFGFKKLRRVQAKSIPPALFGRDILASAKTGSGKTLAFVIPVLENLFRLNWETNDGVGAIILSPTRDLCLQIFRVLCSIGKYHSFSAGLIVGGGQSFKEECEKIAHMNIIVCTTGRLLKHLECNPRFSGVVEDLKMLVLDEADRLLELGFQEELKNVLSHLPRHPVRQTLLFSATQTHQIKKLALLSLDPKNCEYIFIHTSIVSEKKDLNESSSNSLVPPPPPLSSNVGNILKQRHRLILPKKISHYFVTVPLQNKLSLLYHMLKTNVVQRKVVVFVSTIKQVNFICRSFSILLGSFIPNLRLFQYTGNMNLKNRQFQLMEFQKRRTKAVFVSTDICSRGIDFKDVELIIQLDTPSSIKNYIHRVGRTGRNKKHGKSIVFLLPQESDFVSLFKFKVGENQELRKLAQYEYDKKAGNFRYKKKRSERSALMEDISGKLRKVVENPRFKNRRLEFYGRKFISSYVKHVSSYGYKKVDLQKINIELFFRSVGIFLEEEKEKSSIFRKEKKRAKMNIVEEEEEEEEEEEKEEKEEGSSKKIFAGKRLDLKRKKKTTESQALSIPKPPEIPSVRREGKEAEVRKEGKETEVRKEKETEVTKESRKKRIIQIDEKSQEKQEIRKKTNQREKERKRKFDDLFKFGDSAADDGEVDGFYVQEPMLKKRKLE